MDTHTMQYMRSEMFCPVLVGRQNRAIREAGGKKDTGTRATARVDELLRKREPTDLPREVDAATRKNLNIWL